MRTEEVGWFSDGDQIGALWRTPDDSPGPYRVIVQGPGWLGLKDAGLYVRYHQALTDAGFAVLVFDYRGFGGSGGDRGLLSPARQLQDLRSAVTYLETRDDVVPDGIGVFGSGGTGGGNAVLLAAADPRVRAAVSQLPVADGADWLHRMRSEYEWLDFLASVRADRRERVATGKGRAVHPREEIMVPTKERRATKVKADVDGRVPEQVEFAPAVEEILAYRPVDAAAALTVPLLVIGIEGDATTPTDHAERVYAAARGPKELIMQRHTTHYAAYDRYWETVTPRIVAWFDRHLGPANVVICAPGGVERLEVPDAG
ncbi:alpha/beta fold hydrolase [Actinomadura barringtoniae]|uniref:Alpha/beta fold hydrolase n=1 Tax=Actinomadura barringtoniae TaxID=1427535 RepID=A0A939PC96_9ACTN|nr:alpha/beta fold hydrolase [Actinomadura barringtoniae]MBO2449996.1 alpha/beta fold hydrolase [Actinomadura barringtoniae]